MIERLDDQTRAKLRSTQILTSLPQIISELVQNSLDAGVTRVDIGVDCKEWYCWVKDNGSGISKEGLNGLGQGLDEGRYSSSKSYDTTSLDYLSTFGFRGEALASAANLCCLEVSSRTANSRETWSIIVKGGQSLYSGPAVRWRRETPGTVVCIRDAFYNLPVRRHSHTPPARTLELIRQEIETYALVFPHVAFTIENVDKDREGNISHGAASKGRVVRISQTTSTLATFRNLFGRALAEHVEEIDTNSDGLRLSGFISLNGAHSKSYQYIFVNNHPIIREDLHRAIASVFSASTFGKNALDEAGETSLPRSQVRRSPRKAEKQPVYVLNITIPPAELDNCMEPAKSHIEFRNRNRIQGFLVSTVKRFLVKHGFGLENYSSQRTRDESASPVRQNRRVIIEEALSPAPEGYSMGVPEENPVDWEDCYEIEDTNEVVWTDPTTGEAFVIDRTSGNSRPYRSSLLEDGVEAGIPIRRTLSSKTDRPNGGREELEAPDWLRRALNANKNYQAQQEEIRNLGPSCCTQDALQAASFIHRGLNFPGFDRTTIDALNIEKADFCNAQVICQVDKKFIACLLNVDMQPTLVLVDQHAADERVRVERLLGNLCAGFLAGYAKGSGSQRSVQIQELDPPIPVLVAEHEGRQLAESKQLRELLRCWGFHFQLVQEENEGVSSGYSQVLVEGIPKVVSEKLLLGSELQDVIKGFVANMETLLPLPSSIRSEQEAEFTWVKALRWCPQGLVDLINSKACRGAIMFNDTLTLAQCEKLLRQLSSTVFPFQCAHGRPSMIPLTTLRTTDFQRSKYSAVNWADWDPEIGV